MMSSHPPSGRAIDSTSMAIADTILQSASASATAAAAAAAAAAGFSSGYAPHTIELEPFQPSAWHTVRMWPENMSHHSHVVVTLCVALPQLGRDLDFHASSLAFDRAMEEEADSIGNAVASSLGRSDTQNMIFEDDGGIVAAAGGVGAFSLATAGTSLAPQQRRRGQLRSDFTQLQAVLVTFVVCELVHDICIADAKRLWCQPSAGRLSNAAALEEAARLITEMRGRLMYAHTQVETLSKRRKDLQARVAYVSPADELVERELNVLGVQAYAARAADADVATAVVALS
jgi:hypothetical protein